MYRHHLRTLVSVALFVFLAEPLFAQDITTQSPTLAKPASSTAYRNLLIEYILPETPASGSVTLTFSNMSTTRVLHMVDDQSVNFTLDPTSNIAASYPTLVNSVTGGTTIPEGTYTVTLSYQDALSNPSATAVATGVIIRRVTPAPTLTAPSTSSAGSSVSINYSLPQPASTGTVTLTFTSSGATRVLQMVDTQNVSFTLNPTSNLAVTYSSYINGVTGGSSLPDGTYAVSLSYQELIGNPATSVTNTSVVVDTVTTTPTLTKPATNYSGATLPINYSIPETALSGSKRITLANDDRTITLVLKDDASTDFSLDPETDPGANENILSSTATSIPDGTYEVTLSYQDAYGNTASTATNTAVVVAQVSANEADEEPTADEVAEGGGCVLKTSAGQSVGNFLFLLTAFVIGLWFARRYQKI